MILAFAIRRLAYTVRSSAAILNQVSISTEEAGISLGASQLKTFFVITRGNYGTAAALSTILTVITIISLCLFFRLSGKRELSI